MIEQRHIPAPSEVAAATALTTLGAMPLGQLPRGVGEGEDANPELIERERLVYAFSSMGGAALGGGLVGYIAARDGRGAWTGSFLTFGLAGLANGVQLYRKSESKGTAGILGLVGLVGVGVAFWLSGKRSEE